MVADYSLFSKCYVSNVVIDGFFTCSASWRAPFYLTAGLGVLVLFGGIYSIDADHPSKTQHNGDAGANGSQYGHDGVEQDIDRRVDWLGAFLVTAGLVLVTFVLAQGPVVGWETGCEYLRSVIPCYSLVSHACQSF